MNKSIILISIRSIWETATNAASTYLMILVNVLITKVVVVLELPVEEFMYSFGADFVQILVTLI